MIQILISLGILALWALTSLLSREAQPLPPRPVARGPTEGRGRRPRSLGTTSLAPAELAGQRAVRAALTDSALSQRALARVVASSPAWRPMTSRIARNPNPRSSTAFARDALRLDCPRRRHRPARSRSPIPTGLARPLGPEPRSRQTGRAGPPPALSSQINQSMAQAADRPLEITPLEIPLASLSSSLIPLARSSSGTTSQLIPRSRPGPGRETDPCDVRSPTKLREIAILTELLKPPLALRPRSRLR